MEGLTHYTTEHALWRILLTRQFISNSSFNGSSNYDWGINFVGSRGKLPNHHTHDKSCKLICRWNGKVSDKLHYSQVKKNKNTLYDYDTECNNDERLLLSVGSEPLVTNFFFPDEQQMFNSWKNFMVENSDSFFIRLICSKPKLSKVFNNKLYKMMQLDISVLRELCEQEKLIIVVRSCAEAELGLIDSELE